MKIKEYKISDHLSIVDKILFLELNVTNINQLETDELANITTLVRNKDLDNLYDIICQIRKDRNETS